MMRYGGGRDLLLLISGAMGRIVWITNKFLSMAHKNLEVKQTMGEDNSNRVTLCRS
jgi:hypothetical protein